MIVIEIAETILVLILILSIVWTEKRYKRAHAASRSIYRKVEEACFSDRMKGIEKRLSDLEKKIGG